jgi:phospholipid-binding lipoprotein MlaA
MMVVRSIAVLLLLALAGCAGRSVEPVGQTPKAAADSQLDQPLLLQVSDPLEPLNRAIFRFNYEFDTYVYLPVVNAYRFVVPRFIRTGVSNFFDNLLEVRNAGNGVLQARPEVASRAVIRFVVNSTIGLLGFFDVATELGVTEQKEDFGQTLGWWGVPAGPYLVLPILGPSGVRDGSGMAVDFVAGSTLPPSREINETVYFNPAVWALYAIDRRYVQPFRYYGTGSPFDYELVRFFFRQQREFEIQR